MVRVVVLGRRGDQQFFDSDVFELNIQMTVRAFTFMRSPLKAVNRFFKAIKYEFPLQRLYSGAREKYNC